jgi:methionine-rich copper-binding protein CopC
MKKIITLCLFAFIMILSTNTAAAQDIEAIRTISVKQTKELRSEIKTMTSEQTEQIYEAFKNYNKRKAILDQSTTAETKMNSQNKQQLNTTMKNILTAEQFEVYQGVFEKN